MDIAEPLTDYALQMQFADVPGEAKHSAKVFLADSFGVAVAGAKAPLAKEVFETASSWGTAHNAEGCTLFGRQSKMPAASAAFVNSFQLHCQEFDCVHEEAVVHPMATILPALVATAEARPDLSGEDFLTAIIAAVDIAAGLGLAAKTPLKFFRPANAGLFGATLGVARLRGFDHACARNALGIALAHCSGTMQAHIEGKPTLALQAANASRAAVMACDLAAAGMAGPQDVFEGKFGYFALFEDEYDPQIAVRDLGNTYRITQVSHKTHPTGRAAQGGLALVQQALDAGLSMDDIESAVLLAPPIINTLVGRRYIAEPAVNYARLCFPYLAATMITSGKVSFESFRSESLNDGVTADLAARISVQHNHVTDVSTFGPQTLIVSTKNGDEHTFEIAHQSGSPENPLSRDAQFQKFRNCMTYTANRQIDCEMIWREIHALEERPFAAVLKRISDPFV
ncbi:MAG: MmgE/PrpD family protein [Pseudomonadota bacterium]